MAVPATARSSAVAHSDYRDGTLADLAHIIGVLRSHQATGTLYVHVESHGAGGFTIEAGRVTGITWDGRTGADALSSLARLKTIAWSFAPGAKLHASAQTLPDTERIIAALKPRPRAAGRGRLRAAIEREYGIEHASVAVHRLRDLWTKSPPRNERDLEALLIEASRSVPRLKRSNVRAVLRRVVRRLRGAATE